MPATGENPMKHVLPLLLLLAIGCGDNFADVQAADSIEAYEEYLKNNPDSRFLMETEDRLETLYIEKARDEGVPGYDAYLERFPEGHQREDAIGEREAHLFVWAEETNTNEGWERFQKEYPKPAKERRSKVKNMLKVHKYLEHLDVAAPMIEQINLAEDPEGPLDGWMISADVTNNGEKTLETISVTMIYLDEEGHKVGSKSSLVVAPYWKIPVEEEKKKPLKPGDSITWSWTTGNTPDGWARQVKIYISHIGYLKAEK
jgi:hypothetical protein